MPKARKSVRAGPRMQKPVDIPLQRMFDRRILFLGASGVAAAALLTPEQAAANMPPGVMPLVEVTGAPLSFIDYDTQNPDTQPFQPFPLGGYQINLISNYDDDTAGSLAQIMSTVYTKGSKYASALNAVGVAVGSDSAVWGANLTACAAVPGAYATGAQIETEVTAQGTNSFALILSIGGDQVDGHSATAMLAMESNAAENSPKDLIVIGGPCNIVQPDGLLFTIEGGMANCRGGFDLTGGNFSDFAWCSPGGFKIDGQGKLSMYPSIGHVGFPFVSFGYCNSPLSYGALGSITANGPGVSYNTTSDRKLKRDIKTLDHGSIFDKLEAVRFTWKSDGSTGVGFIAQEVHEHAPEVVTPGHDDVPWQMDYAKLVPYLWAEMKALRKRVAVLEKA